ncbi:MAG: cysteine desulfurase NifS [Coprococcus sp.]|nr:cysteine desulfurase NifS [Coprococcus sp.]
MDDMIYLDHAATTAVRPEVVEAMLPYFTDKFANPSGIYTFASHNKNEINASRDIIAASIGADSDEIFFTAGGSESDNWAIKAIADSYKSKGKHIITSRIEHHAVLHTCSYLEKNGYEVSYVGVDEKGMVHVDSIRKAIRPDTILISIMTANNEIGTIQPIREIGQLAHEHDIVFHTDAVQAYGQIPIDVEDMNIDMLSASGHKFNGPKGVGFLYIRKSVNIGSFIHGGGQERGRRAGTENVPGIIGIGKAAELSISSLDERSVKEACLRDYFINRILREIPYTRLNGHRIKRLPNNINVSFQFVEGESILIMLDMAGICASAGSACMTGSVEPSHVLTAIGLPQEIIRGSVRFTLGYENTKKEIDFVVDKLKEIVGRLRGLSPVYQDYIRRNGCYK